MTTGKTSPQSPALDRVARGNLCAGCGGCALVAPQKVVMEMTPPGYLRPRQTAPLTATEDARIARICPGLGQKIEASGRTDHVLWGPYEAVKVGFATDPVLRFSASSGGVLSALLVHLLESAKVDAIIQTAASPNIPVANVTVLSRSAADVLAASGSRYAPSAPLAKLASYLDSDLRFAFVGKPCDVAALRALEAEDPRVSARIPFMLSFFCAGVPSQTGGEAILTALGTDLQNTEAFRYRGNGWPGRATAQLKDNTERSMTYHESWGNILSNHAQFRCKICADGTGKAADLVCADAWHCDDEGYPLFEESDGVSLVLARTEIGTDVLKEAENAGRIELAPFDLAELASIQPGQLGRRRALCARLAGLLLLGRPIPRYRGLHIFAAARQNGAASTIRNFLGMLRRGLTGRLG